MEPDLALPQEKVILESPRFMAKEIGAKEKAEETLFSLSEKLSKPVDFFDDFNKLEPSVQFYVARAIGRTLKQTDEIYSVKDGPHTIKFPNRIGNDYRYKTKFDEVSSGVTINGSNLRADIFKMPALPDGYSIEMIENKILGKPPVGEEPAQYKEISNFVLVAFLFPQIREHRYPGWKIEEVIDGLKGRKYLRSPDDDPSVRYIVEQLPYPITETQWSKRNR